MEGNTGENGRYNNSKNNGESSRQTTERGHSNRGRGGGRMGGLGSPADNNRPPPLLPSYNHNQQDRRNSQENGWPGNRGNFRQGPDRNQGQGGRYQQNLNYYNNTGRNMNAGRGGGNFSNYNNHQNQRMQYMQQQQHSPHYNNNGNDYRQQGNWREDGGGRHEIAVKYYEPDLLKLLEEEGIYQLRRKSLRFQKANFFCRLCEYHCEEPENCVQHIKNSRHQKLATVREFDQYLGSLPLPSTVMEEAVGDAVLRISELHSITQQELEQRKLAVQELTDRLHRLVPEAELEMTGSTYSGLALKTSDVNIHLCINDSVSIVKCIMAVKEIIETSEDYTDMSNDLRCTFPSLSYTATKYGNCRVVVGIGNTSIRAMTRLMAAFVNIDKRFAVLARAFHYWAKLCNVADQKTGSLPTIAFTVMVANFLQQTAEPVLPTLRELCPSGKPENFPLPADVRTTFVQENTQSIGQLWLQMLHYYGREFKFAAFNINVTQSRPSARVDKAYSKKMSVEDPFNPKRNLTRRVSNTAVLEFIMDRLFKILCRYFSVPQLSFGQLFYTLTVDQMLFKEKRTTNSSLDTEDESDKDTSSDLDMALERLSIRKNSLSFDSDIDEHTRSITSPDQITETYDTLTFNEARRIMKLFGKKHYKFEFNEDKFTEGDFVPIFCSSCQQEGHIREDCEDEKLPELKPLGDISAQHIALLSDILINLREEMEPSQEEMKLRGEVVLNLQQQIRKEKYSGALLHLFGSSANGFGFANSDLDVCITFEENKHREQIDQNFLIFDLAQILRRSRQFVDVLPIATAKVPIVKFRCGKTSLEGDLSLYNTLALHNTKLLWTYSVIDPRVKVLGYGLKYFAKRCDIGDASRGSLSSYAFTLLLIHFLQQVQPPVVPVLQKLYNKDNPPTEVQVEGWNAWFYSDLKNMYKAWPGYRKNKKSVGELWIEMFCYYTEKFNFDDNVVTIRQEEPLLRLEKLWNNRSIAIEDPFDLNHNLGGALSRKMNTFIMKAFINGRHMYGGLNKLPIELDKAVEFLFDPKQLTAGAPPNDRGCRRCRRIGHMVKDCPQRKDPNETPKNKKKEQQSNQAAQPQNSGKGQNKQEKPTGMSAKEQRLALSGSAPTKKKDDKALLGEKGMQKIKENLPQGASGRDAESWGKRDPRLALRSLLQTSSHPADAASHHTKIRNSNTHTKTSASTSHTPNSQTSSSSKCSTATNINTGTLDNSSVPTNALTTASATSMNCKTDGKQITPKALDTSSSQSRLHAALFVSSPCLSSSSSSSDIPNQNELVPTIGKCLDQFHSISPTKAMQKNNVKLLKMKDCATAISNKVEESALKVPNTKKNCINVSALFDMANECGGAVSVGFAPPYIKGSLSNTINMTSVNDDLSILDSTNDKVELDPIDLIDEITKQEELEKSALRSAEIPSDYLSDINLVPNVVDPPPGFSVLSNPSSQVFPSDKQLLDISLVNNVDSTFLPITNAVNRPSASDPFTSNQGLKQNALESNSNSLFGATNNSPPAFEDIKVSSTPIIPLPISRLSNTYTQPATSFPIVTESLTVSSTTSEALSDYTSNNIYTSSRSSQNSSTHIFPQLSYPPGLHPVPSSSISNSISADLNSASTPNLVSNSLPSSSSSSFNSSIQYPMAVGPRLLVPPVLGPPPGLQQALPAMQVTNLPPQQHNYQKQSMADPCSLYSSNSLSSMSSSVSAGQYALNSIDSSSNDQQLYSGHSALLTSPNTQLAMLNTSSNTPLLLANTNSSLVLANTSNAQLGLANSANAQLALVGSSNAQLGLANTNVPLGLVNSNATLTLANSNPQVGLANSSNAQLSRSDIQLSVNTSTSMGPGLMAGIDANSAASISTGIFNTQDSYDCSPSVQSSMMRHPIATSIMPFVADPNAAAQMQLPQQLQSVQQMQLSSVQQMQLQHLQQTQMHGQLQLLPSMSLPQQMTLQQQAPMQPKQQLPLQQAPQLTVLQQQQVNNLRQQNSLLAASQCQPLQQQQQHGQLDLRQMGGLQHVLAPPPSMYFLNNADVDPNQFFTHQS